MYLTVRVRRHLIHIFLLSFIGQHQSHKVAIIDLCIHNKTMRFILGWLWFATGFLLWSTIVVPRRKR